MSYQAVIRNADSELVMNSSIGMQISIIQGSISGTSVYVERHFPTTNENGLVSLEIGTGTIISGVFADIDWSTGPYFIKTETDLNGGANYTITGINQLLSVPYALYAQEAGNKDDADADPENEIQDISLIGTELTLSKGSTVDLSILQDGFEKNTDDQTLSIDGHKLSIEDGNTVTLPDNVNDADADPENELQDISLVGNELSISGGSTVTLAQEGITITPNILIGEATGENSDPTRDIVAIGDSALFNNGIEIVYSYNAKYNTAVGSRALRSNTKGDGNTAIGYMAMYYNISGWENTANGYMALYHNTTGDRNTANGYRALFSNTTGSYNTANGHYTMTYNQTGSNNTANGFSALFKNTDGCNNTATGYYALYSNETGSDNTANGYKALCYNSTGSYNTATGNYALFSNTTGHDNTANGQYALNSNQTGWNNTANGIESLYSNTEGHDNTASGYYALNGNTTGNYNVATGNNALLSNTTASDNTALGRAAMKNNTTGYENTATGSWALLSNTEGNFNSAYGRASMYHNSVGNYNTAIGYESLNNNLSGNNNVAVGYHAGWGVTSSNFDNCTFVGSNSYPSVGRSNVTMLGYGITNAQCTGSNQVLLGNTSVSQIRAQVGSLTTYSDARFKTNIKENVAGLDFIMKLKPVTFNKKPSELFKIWGEEVNSNSDEAVENIRYIGFLAQDVEKAANEAGFEFPGIDIPQNEKEVYTLRYNDFIMPLVKSIQEQQEMIKSQKTIIDELIKRIEIMEDQLNKL
ncbi:tail fiber domain-containing protein [Saccharicrinis sp. FJH54]|uniref:tail fiber domain-containing protein n=1 Tax=Saccharicrinis sp. FJH54 TaxID=3344665 RepID=UPI0035D3DBD7